MERLSRFDAYLPVIVAMVAVRVMEMALHQVVHVVAMRHLLMPAVWAVNMILVVASAGMAGGASVRVCRGHGNYVLVNVVAVRMVQVAIVKVVDMPFMFDGRVPTIRAVLMGVA